MNARAEKGERMMRSAVEYLTAKDARRLLAGNGVNRRVQPARVIKMARDMSEGRWHMNPQPIMLTASGRLIDGQHRLEALILASEAHPELRVPFMVARDVPEAAFDVVDQGQPRSSGQTLQIHGVLNSVVVAAAARNVIRYERFPRLVWSGGSDTTKAEVIDFVLKHRDQVELLDVPTHLTKVNLNPSSWTALNWLVIRHSPSVEQWDEFAEGLFTGAGLRLGDPRLTLRNRGKGVSDQWGGGQGRLGVYIRTWNYWLEGREPKSILFRRDSLPMPVIG